MLQVEFYGTHHWDPCGPRDLRDWLHTIVDILGGEPEFVCLEYTEHSAAAFLAARSAFRKRLVSLSPSLLKRDIELIVSAFGYEPEVVESTWPAVPAVWLEALGDSAEDPDLLDLAVEQTAMQRARDVAGQYGTYLRSGGPVRPGEFARALSAFLRRLQSEAHDGSDVVLHRDTVWFDELSAMTSGGSGWAAVVVGAGHMNERDPRTIRSLLMSMGRATRAWRPPEG